jgi:hypothetical protein
MSSNPKRLFFGKNPPSILKNYLKAVRNKTTYFAQKLSVSFRSNTDTPRPNLDERIFTPIIIFQPGKVGSLSVNHSLLLAFQQLKVSTPIYHAHALNNLDEREKFVRETRQKPDVSIQLIKEWKELREDIEKDPSKKWNIISLVREPVAMKVSALFHLLDQHIPDWQQRHQDGNLPMTEIEALFYNKQEFGFKGLEQWYDRQIKALWNIDIFSMDFPREKGYEIYKSEQITLLIIRLEDLNQVAQKAFYDFMGLEEFKLSNVNVGEEKSYADLYKQFKSLPLPKQYIEDAYQTRYARHFYSQKELETFQKRWLKQ